MKNHVREVSMKTRVLRVGVILDRAQASYWWFLVTFLDIKWEFVKIVETNVEP